MNRYIFVNCKKIKLILSSTIRPCFLTFITLLFTALAAKAQMEFVENKGQWDSKIHYRGNFVSGAFFVENNGFTVMVHNSADLKKLSEILHGTANSTVAPEATSKYIPKTENFPAVSLRSHAYKVNFLGSNTNVLAIPEKVGAGFNNYFIGNDQTKWTSQCKIYQVLTYKNVYPNIDVRYYSEDEKLKYDFIVHPGGNPNAIAMRYDGVTKLEVKNQELIIGTSVGDIKELYPYSYQSQSGKKESISCKYLIRNNVVTFKVGNYNTAHTLVIDPSLIFSSFTGSTQDNWGYTATPGPDGSLFAGGIAFGSNYPTSIGAYQINFGGGTTEGSTGAFDMAIFKFSSNGTQRLYATYIGGSGNEQPHSMIADAQGNLVIAGRSTSTNYPRTNTSLASGSGYDIVITKLNAAGSAIIGSVKIGGSGDDGVNVKSKTSTVPPDGAITLRRNYGDDARSEVILDASGNIVLVSCTKSSNFPTTPGVLQPAYANGDQDGVIVKYTSNLTAPLFSTYFGGGGEDACFVISQNPVNGNYYVGGATTSNNLPGNKTSVISGTYQGGITDGFVTQINSTGTAIIKTTYQGTSGNDMVYGLKFDAFGFPYIMGTTTGNWPVINATFNNTGGKQFISKLQPDLSAYVYSTVFGTNTGVPNLSPVAFLVDRCQNVYVSGWGGGLNATRGYPTAGTAGLPAVSPLPNLQFADGKDFYFFVLEKDATSQLFGSHFGEGNNASLGDHVDGGTSRFDANGIIYQAICACKTDNSSFSFPTSPGVWSVTNRSASCNQAALKIEMNFSGVGASVQATINNVIDTIGCVPLTINFTDTLAKGKMYIWDFGDASSPKRDTTFAPVNRTSHVYNNAGVYTVMVIAIDSATCNIADTAFVNVRVGNNEVNPNFTFTKLDSCASLRFSFTNTTTALLPTYTNQTFIWDFGDNSPRVRTGFGPVIHTFPSIGSYNVKLIVEDTVFCNSPDSTAQTIRINPNVRAQFNTSTRGCVPYTPVFRNTSLGGLSWLWEFGDGTTSTDFEPTHTYSLVGSYNVRLIAFDSTTCNRVDTSGFFTITVYPIPTANFSWSPNPPVENTRTNFTNLSSGATRYLWDFGDGTTSTEVNPSHQFNKTDTFDVMLVAFNDADCADTIILPVVTLIKPLLAVPNAFTPGRFSGASFNNGIIKVEGFGIAKMSWKIYNRWGQLVFSTSNVAQGWDGTFKGALQPMDVYTYTLDAEFSDGQKVRQTGDITLLR